MPRTIEMASPSSATVAVHTMPLSRSPRTLALTKDWSTTVTGEGTRKLGLSNRCSRAHSCISHHSPKKMAMPSSGAAMSTHRRPVRGAPTTVPDASIGGTSGTTPDDVSCDGTSTLMCGLPAGRG